MSLHEIEEAASIIQQTADPEANIIVGQVINPDMGEELIITVIATGFEREEDSAAAPPIGADRGPSRPAKAVSSVLASMGASFAVDRPMKDLDRPAFLRRMNDVRESMDRAVLTAEDEWDVPTFLRKQTD